MTGQRRQVVKLRGRAAAASVAAALLLSACIAPEEWVLSRAQVDERTPYAAVSTGQAWVNAPGITAVLQRQLRGESEQRIGLASASAVPGDNVIVLRAHAGPKAGGRLRFEHLVSRIGGLPHPFTDLSPGDLVAASDELGTYLYAAKTAGTANCILGMRRVDSGMRRLPGNAAYMDVILRNCVDGTQQEALVPLTAENIGVAPAAGVSPGSSRMLSPLAAPSNNATLVLTGDVQ